MYASPTERKRIQVKVRFTKDGDCCRVVFVGDSVNVLVKNLCDFSDDNLVSLIFHPKKRKIVPFSFHNDLPTEFTCTDLGATKLWKSLHHDLCREHKKDKENKEELAI